MRVVRALATAILAVALTACGQSSDDAPTGHRADVAFATAMIPHHAQALVMVDMIGDRSVTREFSDLAEQIRSAQAPEIEEMVTWLDEWDEPIPETSRDHVNAGHDGHDNHDANGMMSQEDMSRLEAADDDFQSQWLTMMITHHQGAIDMARTEIKRGKDARAIKLAQQIVATQKSEIATMKALLGR